MIDSENSVANQLQLAFKKCPQLRCYPLSVVEFPDFILITGTVTCFYHKQVAQEVVLKHLKKEVKKLFLKNNIEVVAPNKR